MPTPDYPQPPSLNHNPPPAMLKADYPEESRQRNSIRTQDGPNTEVEEVRGNGEISRDAPRPSFSHEIDTSTSLKRSTEIPIPLPRPSRTTSAPTHNQTPRTPTNKTKPQRAESSLERSSRSAGTRADEPPVHIPSIPPISSGLEPPPNLVELATGLDDKSVDEFGNILDWDGRVLGRAGGDLPSMVGRRVSPSGKILGEDGEVVGYVVENDTLPTPPPAPQPIEGMLGGGIKVDHMGNILDSSGSVIGHFNAAPLAETAEGSRTDGTKSTAKAPCDKCGQSTSSVTPSPSEIFLDVKSTNDGIQLIIKIPTVFNNGGRPSVHIG